MCLAILLAVPSGRSVRSIPSSLASTTQGRSFPFVTISSSEPSSRKLATGNSFGFSASKSLPVSISRRVNRIPSWSVGVARFTSRICGTSFTSGVGTHQISPGSFEFRLSAKKGLRYWSSPKINPPESLRGLSLQGQVGAHYLRVAVVLHGKCRRMGLEQNEDAIFFPANLPDPWKAV